MKFSKRSNQFGEGIFSKLLEIKNQKLADGEPIIDLSVGTLTFPGRSYYSCYVLCCFG